MSLVVENTLTAGLLAALVWAFCRIARPHPALAHLLWLLVLVELVCPPVVKFHLPLGWLESAPRPVASAPRSVASALAPDAAGGTEASRSDDPSLHADAPRGDDPADGRSAPPHDGVPADAAFVPPTRAAPNSVRSDRRGAAGDAAPTGKQRSARTVGAGPAAATAADTATTTDGGPAPTWTRWLWALWLGGTCAVGAAMLRGIRRVHRRIQSGREAPEWLIREVRRVAARLSIEPPEVVVVDGIATAFVWSLGRPRLCWPAARTARELDAHGVPRHRAILAHELAHLRRKDHLVARFELCLAAVLWWHPLLWFARARMREMAELACDAWAVSVVPDGRVAFADALIDAAEDESNAATALPVLGARPGARRTFEKRLKMILQEQVPCRLPRWALAPVVALSLSVLAGPTFAQERERRTERDREARLEARIEQRVEAQVLRVLNEHLKKHLGDDFEVDDLDDVDAAVERYVRARAGRRQGGDRLQVRAPRGAGIDDLDLRRIVREELRKELGARGATDADEAAPRRPRAERARTDRARAGRTQDPENPAVSGMLRAALEEARREIRQDSDLRELGIAGDVETLLDALLGGVGGGVGAGGDYEKVGGSVRNIIDKALEYGLKEAKQELRNEGFENTEFLDNLANAVRGALRGQDDDAFGRAVSGFVGQAIQMGMSEAKRELRNEGFEDVEFLEHVGGVLEAALQGRDDVAEDHARDLNRSLMRFIQQAMQRGMLDDLIEESGARDRDEDAANDRRRRRRDR